MSESKSLSVKHKNNALNKGAWKETSKLRKNNINLEESFTK